MACEMFTMAQALIGADISRRYPALSVTEHRVRMFERLYGDDLDEATRARVVARLRG
jgi:hypothetical protein